jgi:ABC-type multidrug transport system permease subunit
VNAGVAMLFVAAAFVGIISFDSVMPFAIDVRNVMYRERAAETYSAVWFFVGSVLVEIPYVLVNTLAFCGVFFPIVGFSGATRFVLFWLHMSLHVLLMTCLGQLLAYATPSLEVATMVGILFTAVFFLLMGFNPPASQIPSAYKWLHSGSPPSYTLAILTSLVLGECPDSGRAGTEIGCHTMEGTPATLPQGITVQQYLAQVFEIQRDEIWRNGCVVIGALALVGVLALLALRFINYQKK